MSEFKENDLVSHLTYGNGVIQEIESSGDLIVEFGSGASCLVSNVATRLTLLATHNPAREVVIDVEDAAAAVAILDAFYGVGRYREAIVTDMRDALRTLLAKPTPPEPTGVGAVVEDANGFTWVRTHATGYPWHANLDRADANVTAVRKYADINAVRILSEGVTR